MIRRWARAGAALASAVVLWAAVSASAAVAVPEGSNPAVEAKVLQIAAELRCLVCQNETIAGSNAELALDLRAQLRTMVQRGDTQAQIIDYMTARYGDFVLYRPPLKGTTMLLWFGPAVLLLLGLGSLLVILRRRARMAADRFEPDPEELPS